MAGVGGRVAAVVWWPVLLVALVLLGSGVSAVVGQGNHWGVQAGQGLVLGVLALGIALDLRRRGRGAAR